MAAGAAGAVVGESVPLAVGDGEERGARGEAGSQNSYLEGMAAA